MKRVILPLLYLWSVGACSGGSPAEPGEGQQSPNLHQTAGGCACAAGPGGATEISLECFCAEFPGACPSYDEAKQWSHPGVEHWGGCFDESRWWVTEQTGCGKLVVAMAPGLGGWAYTYDETTHELIGAQISNDVPFGSCEMGVYSAGDSSRCDNGTVCSLCDDSGSTCAPACSLELMSETWGVPRYDDEISGYDCGLPEPGQALPELRTGCGRAKVVTALGTNTYSADTHELLAVENDGAECRGSWGDPGASCADETSCSLCDNSPNRCPR